MEQAHTPTALLVEADPSLRRLIALGLQHRGVRVIEASTPKDIPNIEVTQFDLLVLDVDRGTRRDWSLLETLYEQADFLNLPTIILGWDAQTSTNIQQRLATSPLAHAACVDKPFDARILHRTITRLLAERAHEEEEIVAEQEAVLMATYSRQFAPSIWPIITAAGLLIAVTGMLLQFAIAAIGFVIVAVGLLLWTLGARSGPRRVAIS